jgi:cytochrome P450
MLLATHQDIQDRVAAEMKEVFYSDDVEVSYDNINKLDYLERVIKESLRLCPVVPGEAIEMFSQTRPGVTVKTFSLSQSSEERRKRR